MNTIAIVRELADERSLTFFKLSQICDVSHSTLKNSERRGGQLSVDTIERICDGLGITMSEFFARKGAWNSLLPNRVAGSSTFSCYMFYNEECN